MALSTTSSRIEYTADGSQKIFNYNYEIALSSEMKVYLDGVLQTSGYTVAGVGSDTGGTVTFTVAPANGAVVRLQRVTAKTQELVLREFQKLPVTAIEKNFDKVVAMVQELSRDNSDLASELQDFIDFIETMAALPSPVYVGETQPPYVFSGLCWYNPSAPAHYIYYVDADGGQWVEEASQGVDGALRNDLGAANSTVPIAGIPAYVTAKVVGNFLVPEQFGAVGNGIADDTAAISSWLTYLAANPKICGFPNGTYLINTVSVNAPNGLKINGCGAFKALGSNRLNMIVLSNVQGLVAIDGVIVDGSNIVARPFEIFNTGNATKGNVYIGPSAKFINAKNVSPRVDNASGFRVQGKFARVVFEGEVDGVDSNLTSGAVTVGAWFDWTGTDWIDDVLVTSKAKIKNVKNDNATTADSDGIQRMGPVGQHLFFTVEEGAYFENCKGRSIKSQVTGNSINAPIIVRNAYNGLAEVDCQYGGGHVRGARVFHDGRNVLSVISSTTRVGTASDITIADNTLKIITPPATPTFAMCAFSGSDNTDTIKQEGLLCYGNKVIGGSVSHMVNVRVANVVNTNRISIRDNYADTVATAFLNVFEVFNNPPQLTIIFEGNATRTACTGATVTGSTRLIVASDKNNRNITALPAFSPSIASGALTIYEGGFVSVATEGGAATDDLDTISGVNYALGETVVFKAANAGQTVVVKNGTGNIRLAGSDFSLDNVRDRLTLSYDPSTNQWCEVSRSNNP